MDWQATAKLMAMALGAIDGIVSKANGMKADDGRLQYAADAITVIGAIIETIRADDVENLDPEAARNDLELLLVAIGGNDEAADLAVDAKFDDSIDD